MPYPSNKWIRVSSKHPCPVCGKSDWCGVSEDGKAAICMRMQSDKPTKNGGWLHPLGESLSQVLLPVTKKKKRRKRPPEYLCRLIQKWEEKTTWAMWEQLGEDLGVTPRSLIRLDAAWSTENNAWAFPMRDETEKVIGIRLRSKEGKKWAITGSKAGLFYNPTGIGWPVMICEGPTDAAAAIDLGFYAIGRPSCLGQEKMVKKLLRYYHTDALAIVADRDRPKTRPDGSTWRPGLEGAQKLAKAIKCPCRIITPPKKDLRSWCNSGATRTQVLSLIKNAKWQNMR